jgi:outer membrane protein assembly factor BamB
MQWKVAVGEGHSSPLIAAGRIYVFTRLQGQETASSIDPQDGRFIWRQSYPAPYKMNPAAERHGEGPKSTPALARGRLYTVGINGVLTCWDAATGAMRWRKEFSQQYQATSPLYGTAMSPLVDGNLVIAHVGGHDDGALMAFDGASGEVKWRWTGDGPAYASPVIADIGGARQVVTETQNNIVSLSAATGQLLWKIPFTTEYIQNIPTPLVYHGELILSGLSKGIMAIRPSEKNGKWSTETVWHNSDVSLYMSSPVLASGLLFGFSQYKRGQLFCVDPHTGATRWTGPPRQGDNAAVLVSGDQLILLKDNGDLVIARVTGSGLEAQRQYTVADSPTWAHPLVLPNGVVIKDALTLARWTID